MDPDLGVNSHRGNAIIMRMCACTPHFRKISAGASTLPEGNSIKKLPLSKLGSSLMLLKPHNVGIPLARSFRNGTMLR